MATISRPLSINIQINGTIVPEPTTIAVGLLSVLWALLVSAASIDLLRAFASPLTRPAFQLACVSSVSITLSALS